MTNLDRQTTSKPWITEILFVRLLQVLYYASVVCALSQHESITRVRSDASLRPRKPKNKMAALGKTIFPVFRVGSRGVLSS